MNKILNLDTGCGLTAAQNNRYFLTILNIYSNLAGSSGLICDAIYIDSGIATT